MENSKQEMKHTKGDWMVIRNIEKQGLNGIATLDTTINLICTTVHRKEEDANLKLIAAAPDLLKTLQLIHEYFSTSAGDKLEAGGRELILGNKVFSIPTIIKKATEWATTKK